MYLRARTTRTCVSHFPEVVVLVAIDDMVGRHMLSPITCSLIITNEVFFLRTFEHGHIQVLGVKLQYIHKIFPCHIDGTFLEIITKTPVAEHLEHGVVISVVSNLFEVVVLTANAETLLRVGTATGFWVTCTEDNVFPLVHTSISEHQCRVVLDYHRSRRYDCMSFRFEIILERIADFISCHHVFLCFISTFLRKLLQR